MPTKMELERENASLLRRARDAEVALEALKLAIPEEVLKHNEHYQLDLCEDGINSFCQALGVESPSTKTLMQLSIYVEVQTEVDTKLGIDEVSTKGWEQIDEIRDTIAMVVTSQLGDIVIDVDVADVTSLH
jgi:hypothetical protein